WIALGVIGCLALGASLTFILSSNHSADAEASRPKEVPRGAPIVARGTQTTTASAVAPVVASPASARPAGKSGDGDYLTVTFDTLSSYYYEVPNLEATANVPADKIAGDKGDKGDKGDGARRPKDQIPAPIRALDGKKVSIQGFMIPIKLDKG